MTQQIKAFRNASKAAAACVDDEASATIYKGDCASLLEKLPDSSIDLIVSSPPYCMGKEYESTHDIESFEASHALVMPDLIRVLKPGGSLCWQVGWHTRLGVVTPLDYLVYSEMRKHSEMLLRNRIVWTFGHGLHCTNRFSGRHETVLWFTKGKDYFFDLDAVRVSQKYPGKVHSKGPKKGLPSGNPLGKNPGDVWEIPNVKANHVEKTDHPCQFPVGLVHRLVKALSRDGGLVLDPYCGVASTGVAALIEKRRFLGAELVDEYVEISIDRLRQVSSGTALYRSADQEIHVPNPTDKVARRPDGFSQVADRLLQIN